MRARAAPGNVGTDALERLRQCRLALAGLDEDGQKIHSAMFDDDVLSLAHGDGTRRPPPAALKAGIEALFDPSVCALDDYLFLQRFVPLEHHLTDMYATAGIPPSLANNICIECGTTRLFGAFLKCASRPGDLFLAAPTYYHSLPDWCERFGVSLACVPTSPENGYKLSARALDAWYDSEVLTGRSPAPAGLFLFNPTQTGALYTPGELADIAGFVSRRDLVVLDDHVFAGTEFPEAPPAAYLAVEDGMADAVVTVGGVSKSHNLANIRIGWACGPANLIDEMRRYSVSTIISVPRLTSVMALAALRDDADYLRENAAECQARVELISGCIAVWNKKWMPADLPSGGFRLVHTPDAGHSLLLSCRPLQGRTWSGGVIRNSVDVARFFLKEARVAVSPGYSSGLDGCEVRICFGSVALAETYPHSVAAETRVLLQTVEEKLRSLYMTRSDILRGLIAPLDLSPDPEEMFKDGRILIRTAMIDRMLPAMERLLGTESRMADQVRKMGAGR